MDHSVKAMNSHRKVCNHSEKLIHIHFRVGFVGAKSEKLSNMSSITKWKL